MAFLEHRGPAVVASFLNTLEKLGARMDHKEIHERLKSGTGPLWGAAGLAAGLGLGARAQAKYGPQAFWPAAILGAMATLGGAHLLRKAHEGHISDEERTAFDLLHRTKQMELSRRQAGHDSHGTHAAHTMVRP